MIPSGQTLPHRINSLVVSGPMAQLFSLPGRGVPGEHRGREIVLRYTRSVALRYLPVLSVPGPVVPLVQMVILRDHSRDGFMAGLRMLSGGNNFGCRCLRISDMFIRNETFRFRCRCPLLGGDIQTYLSHFRMREMDPIVLFGFGRIGPFYPV